MGHDDDIDDSLAEVKAILGRLQRISRSPGNDVVAPPLQPAAPEPFKAGSASPAGSLRWVNAIVLAVPLVAVVAGAAVIVKGVTGHGNAARERGGGSDLREAGTMTAAPATAGAALDSAGVQPGSHRSDTQSDTSQQAGSQSAGSRSDAAPPGSSRDGAFEAGQSIVLADRSLLPSSPARYASDLLASGQVQAARAALLSAAAVDSADVAFALARSYDPRYLATVAAADAAPDVAEAERWYRVWYDIAVRQGLVSDSVSLERIIRSMD